MHVGTIPLVETKKEKCRMCYTCIRECPAKAIKVYESQASIISERCIGCGNCVRVCSQAAKQVHNSIPQVIDLLASQEQVFAMLAPSFPAEFGENETTNLIGALEALGFSGVFEVAFGADFVAREYSRILNSTSERYIGSTCPSVVSFVQRYFPSLVPHLMPVVSPMVATAKIIKHQYGPNVKTVFIGPCIAKKGEATDPKVGNLIDAVLTFSELQSLFLEKRIRVADSPQRKFHSPRGDLGSLFSVTRGLLQAAKLKEDIVAGDIIAAEGNPRFVAALQEFERGGESSIRLLELLSCNGCIMGVGFSNNDPLFVRRQHISNYVKNRSEKLYKPAQNDLEELDLSRSFTEQDRRLQDPSEKAIHDILESMGKPTPTDELNCGACGYPTCRQCATAIHIGLAEKEMCLPYTIDYLKETIERLEESNHDLSLVREALTQSEKLASMGQMAAGIAHEVNNPLGIVLLYANLMLEECKTKNESSEDLKIIVEQAERCKKIVMGLLNFARQNKIFRQHVDIPELCRKVVRENNIAENIKASVEYTGDNEQKMANVDPDQMFQVLNNLINNACTAMENGGKLAIVVKSFPNAISIIVEDSGKGISKQNMSKIFDPFFSTKPVGKGTGLGLAVVHGIVKMHRGKISVESNADPLQGPTWTRFTVTVPKVDA